MKQRRPSRPKPVLFYVDDNKQAPVELAGVYEEITQDPSKNGQGVIKDLLAYRDATIWGNSIFENMTNKEQAKAAIKLSQFLFKYARWIASRPEGKV